MMEDGRTVLRRSGVIRAQVGKKTRAEYLKQAKAYLEDALTSFPAASQPPTVRENLRFITKDLDKLSS